MDIIDILIIIVTIFLGLIFIDIALTNNVTIENGKCYDKHESIINNLTCRENIYCGGLISTLQDSRCPK